VKKGRPVDDSIHKAMIHAIRKAEHFIYIENQYFLGSCHEWDSHQNCQADNLIAIEIVSKIRQKIQKGESFKVYILLPMYSEGVPDSTAVQDVIGWQFRTIQMMYKEIAKALGDSNQNPQDYLMFFCLGNRETRNGSQAHGEEMKTDLERHLSETRRFMIYVHSKMMIVDDSYVLVGSANINDRSLSGWRDSEIAVGAFQPHLGNQGDVQLFRKHIWAGITGVYDKVYDYPESDGCIRFLGRLARNNWEMYAGNNVVDMQSHLMLYPYTVEESGKIHATIEKFPDTNANIQGSDDPFLPTLLTT